MFLIGPIPSAIWNEQARVQNDYEFAARCSACLAAWDQQETKLSVLKTEAEKAHSQATEVTILETGDEFGKIVLYVQESKRDVLELVELKESVYNSWKV